MKEPATANRFKRLGRIGCIFLALCWATVFLINKWKLPGVKEPNLTFHLSKEDKKTYYQIVDSWKSSLENEQLQKKRDAQWIENCPLKPEYLEQPYDPEITKQASLKCGSLILNASNTWEERDNIIQALEAKGIYYSGPSAGRLSIYEMDHLSENREAHYTANAPNMHAEVKSFYESPLLHSRGMRQIYEVMDEYGISTDFNTLKNIYGMAYLFNHVKRSTEAGYQLDRLSGLLFSDEEIRFRNPTRKTEMMYLQDTLAQHLGVTMNSVSAPESIAIIERIMSAEIDLSITEGLFEINQAYKDELKAGDRLMSAGDYMPKPVIHDFDEEMKKAEAFFQRKASGQRTDLDLLIDGKLGMDDYLKTHPVESHPKPPEGSVWQPMTEEMLQNLN